MVRGAVGVKWVHTSHIMAMLEGCQQIEVTFDSTKFIPPEHRAIEQQPARTQEEHIANVKAFNAALRRGRRI